MTPEEVAGRLAELVPDARAGTSDGYPRATVDVPPQHWRAALRAARDDAELACNFFDWLSAVDELAEGFTVVAHVWSVAHRHSLLVRTRVPRDNPVVDSIVDIYPGAAWHERETHEMFGIDFAGHPGLAPLLLPPEFEGHPLRKEFVLAARVAKPWPGAKEPGESEHAATRRQPMRPPGVPAPGEWGPAVGPAARASSAAAERTSSAAAERTSSAVAGRARRAAAESAGAGQRAAGGPAGPAEPAGSAGPARPAEPAGPAEPDQRAEEG